MAKKNRPSAGTLGTGRKLATDAANPALEDGQRKAQSENDSMAKRAAEQQAQFIKQFGALWGKFASNGVVVKKPELDLPQLGNLRRKLLKALDRTSSLSAELALCDALFTLLHERLGVTGVPMALNALYVVMTNGAAVKQMIDEHREEQQTECECVVCSGTISVQAAEALLEKYELEPHADGNRYMTDEMMAEALAFDEARGKKLH